MPDNANNSNDANTEMTNRYKRDKKLMWPTSPETAKDKNFYRQYLSSLVGNQTCMDAMRMAERKINRAQKKRRRADKLKHILTYVFIMSLIIGAITSVYCSTKDNQHDYLNRKEHRVMFSLFAGAFVLFGAGYCWVLSATYPDDKNNEKPEVFYNRLIVRYFEVLKQKYPDMSEKYLELCNRPDMEMARAIYSLMLVNMPNKYVKKLNELALSCPNPDIHMDMNNPNALYYVEENIRSALSILEDAMREHPELQSVVKDAYACKIPTSFFVVNQSNRSRTR